jgi:hypothetical protein
LNHPPPGHGAGRTWPGATPQASHLCESDRWQGRTHLRKASRSECTKCTAGEPRRSVGSRQTPVDVVAVPIGGERVLRTPACPACGPGNHHRRSRPAEERALLASQRTSDVLFGTRRRTRAMPRQPVRRPAASISLPAPHHSALYTERSRADPPRCAVRCGKSMPRPGWRHLARVVATPRRPSCPRMMSDTMPGGPRAPHHRAPVTLSDAKPPPFSRARPCAPARSPAPRCR